MSRILNLIKMKTGCLVIKKKFKLYAILHTNNVKLSNVFARLMNENENTTDILRWVLNRDQEVSQLLILFCEM